MAPDPYSFSWDAEALFLVPLLAAAYLVALLEFPAARWRIAAFFTGLALILAVFLSPLQTLALHYLLSAHLLQNVVLAEWSPALCVLGLPPTLAAAVGRLQPIHTLTHPLVALPLWLATYFIWHIPVVYDTALHHTSSILHAEHVCYFAAGVILWWPVLQAEPWRLQASAAAAYLFGAFVLASPLGLLLALLPDPIYSFYEHAPRLWGLSALSDQEIAGLTMAAEQAIVFFGAFTVFFMRFLRAEEGVVFVDR